jgi:uroporphyrin-III C-methyltransferase
MTATAKGKVYLVGAGPGDPELLTLKAARLLATADLVLHDDLVPDAIIRTISTHALVMSVGKRCGAPNRIRQADIHALMIDGANRGLTVVRLKCGDPLIFGRAGEEIDALTEAGITYEVVPGITAAFAAAAAIGCSLTDRRIASSVEFHTAHRREDADVSSHPTRVIYMPGRDYAKLAAEWLAAGESPSLPCCIISRAAQPDQQVQWTTLAALAGEPAVSAPSLLLAGWALAKRMPTGDTSSSSLQSETLKEQVNVAT